MPQDLNSPTRQRETPAWFSADWILAYMLLVATALAFYLCYLLARPFLPALAWALALAVIAHPLHSWLTRRLHRANIAAVAAVVLVAVAIVIPALLVTQQLGREATRGMAWLQSERATEQWEAALERFPRLTALLSWLDHDIDMGAVAERLSTTLGTGFASVLTSSVWAIVELLITFFALFYFFRDRRLALQVLRSSVPLSEAETEAMFKRVTDTIYGTVYGTLVVALVQGSLGGLMFWVLGLSGALLWGAVMAILAIVPILGAFVVWVPAVLYLVLEGSWGKAIILTVWGAGVVSFIDNLLYPMLVGQRLRLHTLPVFIAIVGGVLLFGSAGLVLGPITLAVTIGLLEVWRHRAILHQTANTDVHG